MDLWQSPLAALIEEYLDEAKALASEEGKVAGSGICCDQGGRR
jgi:hypothetical protein